MPSGFDLNELLDDEELHADEFEGSEGGLFFDLNMPPEDFQSQQQGHQHQTQQAANITGQQGQAPRRPRKKQNRLSTEGRYNVLLFLMNNAEGDDVNYGTIKCAMEKFNLSRRAVSKIWHDAKIQKQQSGSYNPCPRYHLAGRKRIQIPEDAISNLKIGERTCIRDLAHMLNVSRSTILRMIKRGDLKPHTNALKPALTEVNKVARLQWVLGMLMGSGPWKKKQYFPMYDFVHIDEKWFNLSKKSQRYYLSRSEKGKHRAGQSRTRIPKAMFMAATSRPRFDENGNCYFDGRHGILPFTKQEPAKRDSKYRKKGTMVTKIIESVTKDVTRRMLIDQIIPAIKESWPNDGQPKIIYIQQDNCRAHITQDDPEWQLVHKQDDFTFILVQQPPNSPDLNILDLGFFRSIQSLQHKKMPKSIDQLVQDVKDAYYELEPQTLCFVWITLQSIMNEILKCGGGNNYTVPHMNKERLLREGKLKEMLEAPTWAILEAWEAVYGELPPPPVDESIEREEHTTDTTQQLPLHTAALMQQQVNAQDHIAEADNMEFSSAHYSKFQEEMLYWAQVLNNDSLMESQGLSRYGTQMCTNDHEAGPSNTK